MGSLERRLARLEERPLLRIPDQRSSRRLTETEREQLWLADARVRRFRDTHSTSEALVRGVIALLVPRGELEGTITDVRRRLGAWRPPLPKTAIERVSARAAYDGELPGVECPPEWRESFEAAGELLELWLDVPDETLAEALVTLHEGREEEANASVRLRERLEPLGITLELAEKAVGPDLAGIPEEERDRRLRDALADLYYGEKGYRVQRHIHRLMEER